MCGIAGFTTFGTTTASLDSVQKMGQAIYHRGPDAGSEYIADNIALCHRRLAIIDLSDAGIQPMHSLDDRYVIAFNGEIYNFREHRDVLIAQGVEFRTQTDTEVILALYALEGEACLAKLNGMFAFAIWDKQEQTLFIARDRMGKKPLYYHFDGQNLYFASELKSLLAINVIPKVIRPDAVYDFFAYQYVPDPKTIFNDVFKLAPGHYLTLKAQQLDIQQYWDISFAQQNHSDEKTIKSELTALTKSCTESRMLADVPLGAFLSGGVDSSGVVALMSQIAKEQDNEAVTTCSIGFDDKKFNETEFAQAVADKYNTQHHEFTVHQNVNDNLAHIVSFFDEPFADPSLVPTFFVSELARQKVTVAVAGDGGDEVFAGYEKYSVDHLENNLREKFPKWLRKSVFPSLANLAGSINLTPFRRAKSLLNSLSVDPAMGFYISNSFITDQTWQSLVNSEMKSELGNYHPSKVTLDAYHKADGTDHLAKILYTDMKTYLPGGILVKVDRMSMANSLEVRAPILDFNLVEYAARIPSALKFNTVKNNEKKYILKEIFKPFLPNDILYRKKMGFSVPLADWLRSEIKDLAQEHILNKQKGLVDYFKPEAIEQLWHEHQSKKHDHSAPLWSMLMFQMWFDHYMTEGG
ncbi:asparagine synthase (glutamine-hydrolyzing) [Endozoicomonas sp. G2_1]|uniref:asparagine synthase (glutamine-hydrolyzing) n=1 Tax=Endozoicomonas sp. G2_1 TaxID=2821091 RepID=UPI001ADA0A70|nr:asparagine synthase (glutamine-hydrolyzing) [Endozoicomonas sp. G2_1]MBO9490490.1 asparagine synthase (glutamine-hydrolyzing) [Endozoicomonas sp. G2_1]